MFISCNFYDFYSSEKVIRLRYNTHKFEFYEALYIWTTFLIKKLDISVL